MLYYILFIGSIHYTLIFNKSINMVFLYSDSISLKPYSKYRSILSETASNERSLQPICSDKSIAFFNA